MSEKPGRGYQGYLTLYRDGVNYLVTPDGEWIWSRNTKGQDGQLGEWIPNNTDIKPQTERKKNEMKIVLEASQYRMESVVFWPGLRGTQLDCEGQVYVSNDLQWIWDKSENGGTGGWRTNCFSRSPERSVNQNAPALGSIFPVGAQERTDSMYVWTISAVKKASIVEQQNGKSSEIVAVGNVVAPEQNAALVMFGAKNSEALAGVSTDLLLVTVRQGA